jgi:hypothetical protein
MSASPDIFLSCNREDAATAKRFAEAFAAAGLDMTTGNPFMDIGQFVAYIPFMPQNQECHSCHK